MTLKHVYVWEISAYELRTYTSWDCWCWLVIRDGAGWAWGPFGWWPRNESFGRGLR